MLIIAFNTAALTLAGLGMAVPTPATITELITSEPYPITPGAINSTQVEKRDDYGSCYASGK